MGRYIGERVKSSDIVHLGRRGISKFCANIKHCIVGKSSGNVSQSDLEEEEVTTMLQRIEAYLLIHNQYDEL